MPLNIQTTRQHLQNFDFRKLFNELGWNNPPHALQPADADAKGGLRFHRAPIAELSGITVFAITTTEGMTPEPNDCAVIHAAVTKIAAENILIFTDKARTQCLLYWVKREAGKSFRRPHRYIKGQPGDLFISKLDALRVDISELDKDGNLAPGEGNRRVKKALDVERVTKKFYDQFQKEHAAFLKSFADCIPVKSDAEWYASVMLNRLMFVYFIQHKGFLDNDRDYLRSRLNLMRAEHGRDKFHSFYRYFLIKLFHEGLGGKKRPAELEKLLGTIPYLNGGMFDVHELEKKYHTGIEIPDAAFERVFDYFDKYDWVLDPEHSVRQPGDKEEINPDVLGYIFEKYINQKQMGAYYTKEDITDYISKNTIIPFLFDAARKECSVAFENPNGPTVWDLLAKNPDRYIYAAVRKGVELPLPEEIAIGLDAIKSDLEGRRKVWNKTADAGFALPTEIWREVVARRSRCEEIRKKLAAGEIRDINGLITLNLDIRRFALDVIANCEGTDLLRAFWHDITPIPFSIHRLWYELHRLVCSTHTAQSANQSDATEAIENDAQGQPIVGDIMRVTPPKYQPITQGGANRVYLSGSPLNIRRPILALESLLRDTRYDFMFRPGAWCPKPDLQDLDAQPSKDIDSLLKSWVGGDKPITILDLSGVPVSILMDLVGVVIRLLFDALFWSRHLTEGGRKRPLMFVLEEAHAYLNSGNEGAASIAARRIVKEGRKYGVGAMIVSQRPAEIDPTILSQCGTVFAMRLANATDRSHVTGTVSDNLEGLFNMLPSLRTGEAIIVGEAVQLPLRALIEAPAKHRRPDSHDPKIYDPDSNGGWNRPKQTEDYAKVAKVWRSENPRS